jgi:uncharacterized protein YvpB
MLYGAALLMVSAAVVACSPAASTEPTPQAPVAASQPTTGPGAAAPSPAMPEPTVLPVQPIAAPSQYEVPTAQPAEPPAAQPDATRVPDPRPRDPVTSPPTPVPTQPTPTPTPAAPPDPTSPAISGALSNQSNLAGSTVAEKDPAVKQTTYLWRDGADQFTAGGATSVVVVPGRGVILQDQPSGYNASGEFLSAVHEADFSFDDAVLSWGADAPAGTSLRFELRVRREGGWSGWYVMGEWGPNGGRSISGQRDGQARVDIDILKLSTPATALQYRVLMSTSDAQATPLLRHVSVAYSDVRGGVTGPKPERSPAAARDLPVPQHSQLEQDRSVASLICSPTSLAMVMQYWGANVSVMEAARGVRDRTTGIYGNWPLNTAFAESLGFDARVVRFYSIEQMEREIEAGRPVIISIAFNPGELEAAPIPSTDGHLIVVRGFTANGDVIVNDPIGPNSRTVRFVYKRDQLERIWLRSGGIAYLVAPR